MKSLTQLFSKALLLSCITYTTLDAHSNTLYIEGAGGLGLSDTQDITEVSYTYEQGYLASLSLGYHFNLWRVEIQQRYKSDDLYSFTKLSSYSTKADGKLTNSSQMLNLYYSSGYNKSNFITSVGLGVGVSAMEIENTLKESGILSAQALLNVGYKLTEEFTLLGNYAYFYTFKGDNFQAKGDNTLSLALRYNF